MQEAIDLNIPKSKRAAFERQLNSLFAKLRENNDAARKAYKEIDRLKKANDRSFARLERAMKRLESY